MLYNKFYNFSYFLITMLPASRASKDSCHSQVIKRRWERNQWIWKLLENSTSDRVELLPTKNADFNWNSVSSLIEGFCYASAFRRLSNSCSFIVRKKSCKPSIYWNLTASTTSISHRSTGISDLQQNTTTIFRFVLVNISNKIKIVRESSDFKWKHLLSSFESWLARDLLAIS